MQYVTVPLSLILIGMAIGAVSMHIQEQDRYLASHSQCIAVMAKAQRYPHPYSYDAWVLFADDCR